jgi:iron complex transport system permease protein
MSRLRLNLLLIGMVTLAFALSLFTARGLTSFAVSWWQELARQPGLASTLFLEIRLPRALLGLLVGASLGVTGAVFQGLLRNPLADPGVIGTSGGAAVGAVLAFYFGLASSSALALPLGGLAGAALALVLLIGIAGWNASSLSLVLTGVAISAGAGAAISLVLNLAPSPFAAYEIMSWTQGSLTDRSVQHLALAAPFMLVGIAILLSLSRPLDGLTLGEDAAQSLGFDLRRTRLTAMLGATLAVGAAVSVSGVIGFVGLVAPHLVRPLVDQRPGATLWPAALAGATLLLLADVAVRWINFGPELMLGVLTALVGAPFLILLIRRSRSSEWS